MREPARQSPGPQHSIVKLWLPMRCCPCRHKACDSMDQTGLPLQSLPLQLGCREGQNCQSPNLLVRKSLCPRYQHWGSQTKTDSKPVILQNHNKHKKETQPKGGEI